MQSFIVNSHEVFIHIHQGCFAGTGAIVRLPQYQRSKPDGYGKISQCITTTKHSKAKTLCIFLGIYCRYIINPPCLVHLLPWWISKLWRQTTLIICNNQSSGSGPGHKHLLFIWLFQMTEHDELRPRDNCRRLCAMCSNCEWPGSQWSSCSNGSQLHESSKHLWHILHIIWFFFIFVNNVCCLEHQL